MKRKNLDKMLVEYDLTQGYVADRLGISEQHFSSIINGRANPSFGLILKFEEFCYEHKIVVDDMWELWKLI